MNDDGSIRYEISSAQNALEELMRNGDVSKRAFATLCLGLDALARQDELAHNTGETRS
jgi:hypothetical protein